MDGLWTPQTWMSLLTLTVLEIVLGVDNLVFLAVQVQRLPVQARPAVARLGLGLALISRLALLAAVAWLANLTAPIIRPWGHPISWRDLILIAGGLFLLYKGTREIHERIDRAGTAHSDEEGSTTRPGKTLSVPAALAQIIGLDIVFSLDSVITAVGIASRYWVMATAITVAIGVMVTATSALARLLDRHPSLKVLAFSFLLLIGMTLVADGAGLEIPKAYLYTALAFSLLVEGLNVVADERARARRRSAPRPEVSGGPRQAD
jgi:predicted tellurium resistance membrane protein TerC